MRKGSCCWSDKEGEGRGGRGSRPWSTLLAHSLLGIVADPLGFSKLWSSFQVLHPPRHEGRLWPLLHPHPHHLRWFRWVGWRPRLPPGWRPSRSRPSPLPTRLPMDRRPRRGLRRALLRPFLEGEEVERDGEGRSEGRGNLLVRSPFFFFFPFLLRCDQRSRAE